MSRSMKLWRWLRYWLWQVPVREAIPRTHWSSHEELHADDPPGTRRPAFVIWKQWLGRCYACFYLYPSEGRVVVGKQSWRRSGS